VASVVLDTEGEGEALGVTLPEPLTVPVGASLTVPLGVALPVAESERLGRLECVCVADTVKVTPVGKAVMLTVGVPGWGVEVTVMVTLGELEGDTDTEALTLGVLEVVVEAVMVPEMRAVPERPGVPLPQGLEVCVLVGGWLRVCVALPLGVLELEALPVMVTEAVAVLLACALAVKDSVSVEEAEDVRVVTGEGVGGALRERVPLMDGEPLSRLPVGDRLPLTVGVLLAVAVRVELALPDTVALSGGERDCVGETAPVRVGGALVAVPLAEAEGVLLPPMLRVPLTDTVDVLEAGAEPVAVLLAPTLRLGVPEVEGDLVDVMVRVPLGVAVPVLEEVVVAVDVAVPRTLPDTLAVRE